MEMDIDTYMDVEMMEMEMEMHMVMHRARVHVERLFPGIFPYAAVHYDPFHHMAEKSHNALRREEVARTKFDTLRARFEHSLLNNKIHTIQLGNKDEGSLFSTVPEVCLEKIMAFVKPTDFDAFVYGPTPVQIIKKKPVALTDAAKAPPASQDATDATLAATKTDDKMENVKEASPATAAAVLPAAKEGKKTPPAATKKKTAKKVETTLATLDINTLYKPGCKLNIPLLTPDEHLTAPCWRDFSRHVRNTSLHWNVLRRAATIDEKKAYGLTRRPGQVYFVYACYTVPGGKKTAARKKKKASEGDQDAKIRATKKVKTANGEPKAGHSGDFLNGRLA